MVIMWLYDRLNKGLFPDKTFREEDINRAFQELFEPVRQQREYYADMISYLSEYFLRYDDQLQVFSLKAYAIDFCKRAHDVLWENFNPTKIETICRNLKKSLGDANNEPTLRDWLISTFAAFQPELKNQIDFLERQIQESVEELRRHANQPDSSVRQALEQVVFRLGKIKEQNKELTAAFDEIDDIKGLLDTNLAKGQPADIRDEIANVFSFFSEMLYALHVVDRRIDRIQPKLRQLFGTLDRPLFNSRVERFIRALLHKSEVKSDATGQKLLMLPMDLLPPVVYIYTPNFTIIERRGLPTRAKRMPTVVSDPVKRQQAFAQLRNRLSEQEIIDKWIALFEQEVAQHVSVDFTPFFFRILDDPLSNFNVAARIAYAVFKQYAG
ncbi:hypothetical protein GCM10028808_70750 [Spirosoma migulaei]